jgi:hypothetical protein
VSDTITLTWQYLHPPEDLQRIVGFQVYWSGSGCTGSFMLVAATNDLDNLARSWTHTTPGADPCYYVVGVYMRYDEVSGSVVPTSTDPTNFWCP